MGKNIKIDFDPIVNYFKNLKTDMIIAYCAVLLGIILLIVSLTIL
ncbi:MAG: hypothetical protein ACP5N1_00715 [Candidatus Woesearchaeota archaeon]